MTTARNHRPDNGPDSRPDSQPLAVPGGRLDAYRYRRVGPIGVLLGDARRVRAAMAAASVDCLVTSPPLWSLKDYGTGAWHDPDPSCPRPTHRTAAG